MDERYVHMKDEGYVHEENPNLTHFTVKSKQILKQLAHSFKCL